LTYDTARKTVISVFVVFHLVSIAAWNAPAPLGVIPSTLQYHVSPYMRYFGVWQYWNMFAPIPLHTNMYLKYKIIYRDDTMTESLLPRMQDMEFFERYVRYHWSKLVYNLCDDNYTLYLDDVGRYLARSHNIRPHNPPIRVDFYRVWSEVPSPGEGLGKPTMLNYEEYNYHSLYIYPGDLL